MAQAQTAPEAVRVRLLADAPPAALTVESTGAPVAIEGAAWSVPPGQRLRLGVRDRAVEASAQGEVYRSPVLNLSGGPFRLRAGSTDRTYLGDLTVRADGESLEIVNAVPLEDYVASVVAVEYPFSEAAGIEAQAVLARTYALRRAGARGHFDLDDHQGSQVYRGEGVVTARSRRAALATSGEVLTYGGALAETPYFSSSGGHTADNEAVWRGAPLPYLRGVPDPADADAPDYRWTTSVPRRDVHDALARRTRHRVTSVEVGQRSRSGRAKTVRLGSREITGNEFRAAVNAALGHRTIRSTHFDVRADGDRYVFEGRGYGHGVGMSQYGARGLARQGLGYREILEHYFAGTTLDRLGAPAYASDTRREGTDRQATRPRTWPVPRRVAREAASSSRRRAW